MKEGKVDIMDKKQKVLTFEKELQWIKSKNIRRFVIEMISLLPDYFFEIPASSTGKYHPEYSLGKGGLVRHTKGTVVIAKTLLDLPMFNEQWTCDYSLPFNDYFTDTDKDIIIASLILHDGLKCGINQTKYTIATHPTEMVNFIKSNQNACIFIDETTLNKICGCIASHMGQWNTNKNGEIILPTPQTEAEKFVHLCDYLASRRYIEINFEKVEY